MAVTFSSPKPTPLRHIAGQSPTRDDNLSKQQWADNISHYLRTRVDSEGGLTPTERTAALNAADQIAETYVEMVQARAISQFSLEGHSNTMFGHGGLSAGLSGNNRDWQCNCDAWTNLFKNSLKSSLGFDPEATGWDFKAHTNVWKAGDIALGYFWPHNFISVTFDPTGTHPPTPTLIFDPWYRARPDVYAPEDHGQLWQLGWWNTEDF